jgi:cytochrome P450
VAVVRGFAAFLRSPRRPTNWRRLGQLAQRTGAAEDGMICTESGLWVTDRPEHARQILVTHPERYADVSAFVRVDHTTQLPPATRTWVVRELVRTLHGALPTDWGALVETWVGDRRALPTPGWGMRLLRVAFADAVAAGRSPELASLVDLFVERNLIRHSTQGRYGLRRRYRIQALGRRVGEIVAAETGGVGRAVDAATDGRDLVDLVARVPDLSVGQRGELLLRLVVSIVGATGAALEWTAIQVAAAMAGDPGWQPTRVQVAAVVAETQRLYPTSWLLVRQATEEHQIGEHRVAAGGRVAVLTYALHRSPDSWPEPDIFDPGRWHGNAGAGAAPGRGGYLPFSAGRSACPGRSVAVQAIVEATLALASRYRLTFRQRPGAVPNVRTLFAPPDGMLHLEPRQ